MKKILGLLAAVCLVAFVAAPSGAAESYVIPADAYLGSDQIVLTPDLYALDPSTAPMNAQCNGTLVPGTYHDVTIPAHDFCYIPPGTHITNDVRGYTDSSLLVNSGVIIDHDVVMQNARSLQFGGEGERVGHDFRVNGLAGVPGAGSPYPNYICNTFIGHDLAVTQLAATSNLTIEGTGAFSCAPVEVAHDVGLTNNAGFLNVSITGGGGSPPPGYQPCTDGAGPAAVGHDLVASGNTAPGPLSIQFTNICHDMTITNNSGGNDVTGNNAGDDANCSNNNPVVALNTAEDQNNGCL
jgi:hypothetical protein